MKFKTILLFRNRQKYFDKLSNTSVCHFGLTFLWKQFFPVEATPKVVMLSYSTQPFAGSKAFRIFKDPSIMENVYRIQIGNYSSIILPDQLRKFHPTKKQEDFRRVYLKIESV